MFCSACKRIEREFDDKVKRKICDSGHIFCSICDEDFQDCSICGAKIVNLIYIDIHDNIPRLQISSIEADLSESEDKIAENQNEEVKNKSDDSIKELTKQLKDYDVKCNDDKNEKTEHPTIGCFQVLAHCNPNHPVSYTLSLDDDEERIILQNFRVVDKPKKTEEKLITDYPSFGEGDGSSLQVHQRQSSTDFTRSHSPTYTTRSGCLGSEENFSYIESALQIYKNEKISHNSSMAQFPTLNPSQVELSPPEKSSMVPSNAHRVKFMPVYDCDSRIPPQMEPLGLFSSFDIVDSSMSFEKKSLSRMPVTCPISTCCASSLPSNFYNHIVNDHPYINIVKLSLHKLANFTICPVGNLIMCHRMFLVDGKLCNIGYGVHENCLPILIVSAKINMQQIFGSSLRSSTPTDEVFCIWPVSIFEHPVKYTLTVWTHGSDETESTLIKCISSTVHYLSIPQNFHEIFNNSLVLNKAMLEKLTSKDSLISCQITLN